MNWQTKTIKKYELLGYYVINLIATNKNGIPDLICLKDSEILFIECKEGKDKVSELQRYRHKELMRRGFNVKIEKK